MNRRQFLASTAALAATSVYPSLAQTPDLSHGFPASVLQRRSVYRDHAHSRISLGSGERLRSLPGHEVRNPDSLGNLLDLASRRRVLALPSDVL